MTSRDQSSGSWWTSSAVHAIAPISEAEGAEMLRELAPDAGSEDDAVHLARRLGGLPLALLLVGKYLAMTSGDLVLPESEVPRTFTAYGQALDAEFAEAVAALPHDPHGPLGRTWEMSLDLLEMRGIVAARPLFRLISFFAPEPLPVVLLRRSGLAITNDFKDLSSSGLEAAVRGLLGCGLLHRRRFEGLGSTAETLIIHPLVREITRTQPAAVEAAPVYSTLSTTLLAMVAKGLTRWPRRTGLCGGCCCRTASMSRQTRRPLPRWSTECEAISRTGRRYTRSSQASGQWRRSSSVMPWPPTHVPLPTTAQGLSWLHGTTLPC
ncbi:hypothetical protein ACFQ3Z_24960 [Streptomyces nogalater]